MILAYRMSVAVCILQWENSCREFFFFILSILRPTILVERCDVIHVICFLYLSAVEAATFFGNAS